MKSFPFVHCLLFFHLASCSFFLNDVSFGGLYLGSQNCIYTFSLLMLCINKVCENTNNDVCVLSFLAFSLFARSVSCSKYSIISFFHLEDPFSTCKHSFPKILGSGTE